MVAMSYRWVSVQGRTSRTIACVLAAAWVGLLSCAYAAGDALTFALVDPASAPLFEMNAVSGGLTFANTDGAELCGAVWSLACVSIVCACCLALRCVWFTRVSWWLDVQCRRWRAP